MPMAEPIGVPAILVVDDEPLVRASIVKILGGWGFQVREAETIEEAMTVLTTFVRERPQLVIIDIILPDGNGIELARQVREEVPAQPILYMSAYPRAVIAAKGLPEDEEFMTKPFDPPELVARVEAALGRRRPAVDQRR